MNKRELAGFISVAADLSGAKSEQVLNSILNTITEELRAGGSVNLVGFGSFQVRSRPARKGRNPRTGEAMDLAASKVPTFRAGKALKEAVQ